MPEYLKDNTAINLRQEKGPQLNLRAAGHTLKARINRLDLTKLDASEYFKLYVNTYIDQLDAILPRYEELLFLATAGKNTNTFSLLDFGGGTGILALLAKTAGLGYVVYADISEEMLTGARNLAVLLDIQIDSFLNCSYENLDSTYTFDAIANYDVLEHLYNPREAFIRLGSLLRENGVILMASSANTFNPLLNLLLTIKHHDSEYRGTISGKAIDSREAFYAIRRRMLAAELPNLSAVELDKLTRRTRGKRQNEIIQAAQNYRRNGELPPLRIDSNTCDPLNGNWDEHLINYFNLANKLKSHFAEVQLIAGHYPQIKAKFSPSRFDRRESLLKRLYPHLAYVSRLLAPILNKLIDLLPGRLKYVMAPYYLIAAHKNLIPEEQSLCNIYSDWNPWQTSPLPLETNRAYTPALSLNYVLCTLKNHPDIGHEPILDLGCGNGEAVLRLEHEGYHVSGVDLCRLAEGHITDFHQASATALPFADASFGCIYTLSVLHHIDDLELALSEIKRVLKPDGLFIATFHTRYSPFRLAMAIKQRFFPERFRHYDYLHFRSIGELERAFKIAGFKVLDRDGLHPIFGLHYLVELFEGLRLKLKLPGANPFFRLERVLKPLLPVRLRTEIAYHSIYLAQKENQT